MDREFAMRVATEVVKCEQAIDAAYEAVCAWPHDSHKAWLQRKLADSKGVFVEIMIEIGKQNPELYLFHRGLGNDR